MYAHEGHWVVIAMSFYIDFSKIWILSTTTTIRMGPKCTSVKTSNFRTFHFPNFPWQWKIPTLKFKKFQRDWVSFSEIESVSVRLGRFQRDWVSFSEIGSVSVRLGLFQRDWVSFCEIGSVSVRLGQFQQDWVSFSYREWEGWISADGGSNVPLNFCWTFFFVTLLTFGT